MQVVIRRAPRRHTLGQAVIVPPQPVVFTRAMLLDRRISAAGYVFGGLASATSLLLFALGKDKAGYMLGIASALWGATIGAIRVFAEEERTDG